MRETKFVYVITLILTAMLAVPVAAQVQTEVPPVIPGAKPVQVERIKVHGAALEGNLEKDAVDRDVLVFCRRAMPGKSPAVTQSSMLCTAIPSARSNGARKSMCRKPLKARLPKARKR